MLDSLFPPASYTPRQPVPHTTIMAHHHRKYKYTTRSSSTPRPRMNVCNVVYTPHPTADDILVRSPCKIPVERPGFRCPAHEAEYRESAREYTFWMEQGNALEDPFTLSPQSVNAFCDIEEVQMRWFAVKEAMLVFSSEATKRMVHWYRFYKDQDPSCACLCVSFCVSFFMTTSLCSFAWCGTLHSHPSIEAQGGVVGGYGREAEGPFSQVVQGKGKGAKAQRLGVMNSLNLGSLVIELC